MGLGGMLGFSYGKKKTSGTSDTTLNKNVATTSQQTQSGREQTSSTQNSQTQSNSASQGRSDSSNLSQTSEQQSQQSQQQATQQSFSNDILVGLEAAVSRLLGSAGSGSASSEAAMAGLNQLADFDLDQFVNDSVSGASQRIQSQVDDSLNQLSSAVGGNAGSNSAVALLAQQLQGDAAAQIQGVRGQATETGMNILGQNVSVASQAGQTDNALLASLSEILKGGRTQTTQAGQVATTGTGATATQGSTATQEQSQQAQASTTQVFQDVISLISSLLQSNESTQATENVKTKGSQTGFGMSGSVSI